MCYTGWCPFESQIGPNTTKCRKSKNEKCPLDFNEQNDEQNNLLIEYYDDSCYIYYDDSEDFDLFEKKVLDWEQENYKYDFVEREKTGENSFRYIYRKIK